MVLLLESPLRFLLNRTVRRVALDNELLPGNIRIRGILEERIACHKTRRSHRGIQPQIPGPDTAEISGSPNSTRASFSADAPCDSARAG